MQEQRRYDTIAALGGGPTGLARVLRARPVTRSAIVQIAADPARRKAHLVRASMIDGLRKAASVE